MFFLFKTPKPQNPKTPMNFSELIKIEEILQWLNSLMMIKSSLVLRVADPQSD